MSWIVMEDSVPLDACDWPGLQFSLRTWSTATSRMPRSPWRRVPCCRNSLERCSCRAACSVLVMWTRCKNLEHMVNYRSCNSLTKFDIFLNIHFHHLSHDVLGDVFTGSRCNPKCSQNRSKWLDSAWPFPEGSKFGPIFPWWKPFPIKNEKMPKSPEHILILITFLRT